MKPYRVKAGKFTIAKTNPDDTTQFKGDKEKALLETAKLNQKLQALQSLMYAEKKNKLLVVIQAMDAGGKDGVISKVFDGVDPAGVRMAYFGAPTPDELSHDYLWRIHSQTPRKGEIMIFNRSHYESVLVERVRGYADKKVWKKRYGHIRNFEQMLVDEGVTIVKIFLNISKEEQRIRQQERIDDPKKRWKFRKGDLEDRAYWDQYMAAFEDALNETSTDSAPWFAVPANRNWYRDWVITNILVDTLESLHMKYPEPEDGLEGIVIK